MTEERSQFAQRIDEHTFPIGRRGYDKREVQDYLEDLEQAFRELEGHARRTAQRVGELERDLSKARATEKVSVDNAMMAVFDAKDRILERARRKADEIEEHARSEATKIKAAALTEAGGGAGAGGAELEAARAQADEIVASARREADRMRESAESGAGEDLEAELAATAAALRRAHADTASAREELDAARKRIVELEADADSNDTTALEQRFAELESHLSAARSDLERVEAELAARDEEVTALKDAMSAADNALAESKTYVTGIESTLDQKSERITVLEGEVEQLQAELAESRQSTDEFAARMRSNEASLAADSDLEDQTELVAELMKANAAADKDTDRITGLEAAVAAGEQRLAEAEQTIADLEAQQASESGAEEASEIIAAAKEEAEAIKDEAGEEAEQRAAKVITKAREEADQVRQTVATLTAQAEDARSSALRSKLEAEDLAEAQRAMGEARDDIVAAAESRAREIEEEAERATKKAKQHAETAIAEAEEQAEKIRLASEQKAALVLAEAVQRAGEAAVTAATEEPDAKAPDGDELAAMMAETERELAGSEELRRQRADLELQEQQLVEGEQILLAQQAEAEQRLATRAGAPPVVTDEPEMPVFVDVDESEADADDENPEERLSTLLEQIAPLSTDEFDDTPGEVFEVAPDLTSDAIEEAFEEAFAEALAEQEDETVDLDSDDDEPEAEPTTRMAWPTQVLDESGTNGEGDPETDGGERESRYRSRSAQLPRLGSKAKSNMTTMANLRRKSRGSND